MQRFVVSVAMALALAGCSEGRSDQDAEGSVKEDADRLADVLEPLCERKPTCPKDVPQALLRSLDEGNEVTIYDARQFEVLLCVANDDHDVWAWYHSEYETETGRGGEPCTFE